MGKEIVIFDSTLRDGAQGEGISFSVEDKLNITVALDKLGISYIEAGNPASNPKDIEFFERAQLLPLRNSRIAAFGSTRRKNIPVEQDEGCLALLSAGTDTVTIFGKSWDMHVTEILHTTLEENLRMIEDTVRFFIQAGREVIFDAEHFFDGYKHNPSYAIQCLRAAQQAGASVLVLCDTNGGCFPDEVSDIVAAAKEQCPKAVLGIHCHNDAGCAVANSIAAVRAGAVHVQGTYLGFGERCGNATLSTLIPDLQLKLGYSCIPEEQIPNLTKTAHYISEVSNNFVASNLPYVGKSAFAHKGGMHVDGVSKLPDSFEHINPAQVGNERVFLMSEMAGKAAVYSQVRELDETIQKNSPQTKQIVEQLKEMENRGYQFESAAASLQILMLRELGKYRPFFELAYYKLVGEQYSTEKPNRSSAIVKVIVDGKEEITAAEGDGPVHALDSALRKALEVFYPQLADVRLIDYKVRVMEPKQATAAMVRVLIESTDGEHVWTTVGVSQDIINASWLALSDSIEYKLMNDQKRRNRQ